MVFPKDLRRGPCVICMIKHQEKTVEQFRPPPKNERYMGIKTKKNIHYGEISLGLNYVICHLHLYTNRLRLFSHRDIHGTVGKFLKRK